MRSVEACLQVLHDILRQQQPPADIGLCEPATDAEIIEAERRIGLPFPADLKELLRYSNGQRTLPNGQWYYFDCDQFIPTLAFRSLGYHAAPADLRTATGWIESAAHVVTSTQSLRDWLHEGGSDESFECYGPAELHDNYLVFLHSENSDTLALDLKPSAGGVTGQVVSIDTSACTLCVVSDSLRSFFDLLIAGFSHHRYAREPDSIWLEKES